MFIYLFTPLLFNYTFVLIKGKIKRKECYICEQILHIKKQFSGALQNAYALAGVLGIEIDLTKVKTYTVYRNDKLNDASNPVKLRYGINTKGDSTGSLEQKEWSSDTVEIDFTEKVILEHCKVQLDIETGAGQCRLA